MKIYDQVGQEITTLIDSPREAGIHHVSWNGQDKSGKPVASGIYIYQFIGREYMDSKKIMLLK